MGFGGGIALAASGVMVTAEVALTISAYKRGVELLSTHVAKTAFRCEAENKSDGLHPASPLIRWWARHHQMSAFEFRRTLMVHALTSGNGYAYIVRDMGMASELLLLDPSQVEPEIIGGKLWYKITGRQLPGFMFRYHPHQGHGLQRLQRVGPDSVLRTRSVGACDRNADLWRRSITKTAARQRPT